MIAFDKAGVADKGTIGRDMAISFTETIERHAASWFINGFNTSYSSYSDGKQLFSTLHTRVDGGAAFSNASSTGLALTHDNLAAAIQLMSETLDDRGNMVMIKPKYLLVPPALETQALEIVKSSGRSDTADNVSNVMGMREYTGGMINVVVWPYLGSAAGGSDTAWFLLSDTKVLKWYWVEGFKPQIGLTDTTDQNKTGQIAFAGKMMRAMGWGNPRGIWGSKGDGAANAS